jgi:hypothetical protein
MAGLLGVFRATALLASINAPHNATFMPNPKERRYIDRNYLSDEIASLNPSGSCNRNMRAPQGLSAGSDSIALVIRRDSASDWPSRSTSWAWALAQHLRPAAAKHA